MYHYCVALNFFVTIIQLLTNRFFLNFCNFLFCRFFAGEIGQEYQKRVNDNPDLEDKDIADLLKLVSQVVPYFVKSNAEPEAIDLLLEVERLENIVPYCDKTNYGRVCLYLTSASKYFLDPDNVNMLKLVHQILIKLEKYPEALRTAITLNDQALIEQTFTTCNEKYVIHCTVFRTVHCLLTHYYYFFFCFKKLRIMKKQMAFMLARARIRLGENVDVDAGEEEEEEQNKLSNIIGNAKLSSHFTYLAKELDCLEPKTPEDIYKSHLTETRSSLNQNIDSARQNLASTFVNAFVNAGFSSDKLMLDEASKWVYKNKDAGMMSATASLGMIYQWNADEGLIEVDKYLYAGENHIKGGALMAIGIIHSGVHNSDAAYALLSEHVEGSPRELRIGAILGLAIAYAGTKSQNVQEILLPIVADAEQPIDVVAFAGLALGVVFAGTCNDDILGAIISALTERDEKQLTNPLVRFLCLALGLLFLGKQDACEAVVETTKTFNEKIAKYCQLAVETCAHAGTGNVLKIQELLKICGEHIDEGKENKHQALAVIGIALVALGEELGSQMTIRSFDHILQYCDANVKRAVPLALGFLNISNPNVAIMDTLSKLSHDADGEIADSAIFALGLIGAGTNNARIAQLLRQLSTYYSKDPSHLFMVRLAQGILFSGKGLVTMSPLYSDRLIISPVAIAGLLTVMHACLDMKSSMFFFNCVFNLQYGN